MSQYQEFQWKPPTFKQRLMKHLPTIYESNNELKITFANCMSSKALFLWAIALWYIDRRLADEALFFYTYQRSHCRFLKRHRFHFPKSFMLAHCEHNAQVVRFILDDKRMAEEKYPNWPM